MRRGDLLRRAAARLGGVLTRLATDPTTPITPEARFDTKPATAPPERLSPEGVEAPRQESPPPEDIRTQKRGVHHWPGKMGEPGDRPYPQDWRGEPRPDDLTLTYTFHADPLKLSAPPVRWSKEEELRKSWERTSVVPDVVPDVAPDVAPPFLGDAHPELDLGEEGVTVEGVEAGTVPEIPATVISESQGDDLPVPPSDSETALAWWKSTFGADAPSVEVALAVMEMNQRGPVTLRVESKPVPGVRLPGGRNEPPMLLPDAIARLLDVRPQRPLPDMSDDVTEANVSTANAIAASKATVRQLLRDTSAEAVRAISTRIAPLLHPVLAAHVLHLDSDLLLPWFQSERERCRLIPFEAGAARNFKGVPVRLPVPAQVEEELARRGWFPYVMEAKNTLIWVGWIPVSAKAAPLSAVVGLFPDGVVKATTRNWALFRGSVSFIAVTGTEPLEFHEPDDE